jgi:hypothetical protein
VDTSMTLSCFDAGARISYPSIRSPLPGDRNCRSARANAEAASTSASDAGLLLVVPSGHGGLPPGRLSSCERGLRAARARGAPVVPKEDVVGGVRRPR